MELLPLLVLVFIVFAVFRAREQARRIALLGSVLGQYRIEQLMENLTEGYLRWVGENDPDRRTQIWGTLQDTEQALASQFGRFAADFAKVDEAHARVSRLSVPIPFADKLLPAMTFDVRRALAIHARGIAHVVQNTSHLSPKDRAYMMTAELFLMQHTCHWYCKSKTVASARMLARHQTPHEQLVASVSAETRNAYLTLINGG